MKLRRNLLELVASLLFVLPLGGYAQNGAEKGVLVPIAGRNYLFSAENNQLYLPSGEIVPQDKDWSHTNATGFLLGEGLPKPLAVRFYTGAQTAVTPRDAKAKREMAAHEYGTLKALSQNISVAVVQDGEVGPVGQGTLYAALEPPMNGQFVTDHIKNGTYDTIKSAIHNLAAALSSFPESAIGLEPAKIVVGEGKKGLEARLARIFLKDTFDGRITTANTSLTPEHQHSVERINELAKVWSELVKTKNIPDLDQDASADSPAGILRLIVHSLQVKRPIWIYDSQARGRSHEVWGKIKIIVAPESFDDNNLFNGFFRAQRFTSEGNLAGTVEWFEFSKIEWARVEETKGSKPAAKNSKQKLPDSKTTTISKRKLAQRQKQLAELKKSSRIRKNQLFKFPKPMPNEVLETLNRLPKGAELRIEYDARYEPTERAKREAAPALRAKINLKRFTGNKSTIDTTGSESNWKFLMDNVLERVAEDTSGKHYPFRSFFLAGVRSIRVIEPK